MRYTILFSIFLFAILSGCNKDKFNTTPSLKFTSVNTTELRAGQLIQFTLTFTDAEGDLSDSVFIQKLVPNCESSGFAKQLYALPSFPTSKDQQGDILITFGYNASPYTDVKAPRCSQNDTAVFRFALRDKANHVSDTISSPPIIIYN
ncbi:MAG TPA: hypothetical protein VGW31_07035 [Hanamia sp.]|jgi:hypothetical protein|nr:hypothetical protein [Hanamia sp.]